MKCLFQVFGVVTLALAFVVSVGIDFSHEMQGGAADFRNRITGARLIEHGIDPYHFIWYPGDPAEFCDWRNNPKMTVSKTTVTPTMLVIYGPLAALPYRVAQFLWLFMQWLLLLGTAWLWLRGETSAWRRWAVAFFLIGFTFTPGWRWEAERGQCYALLFFLFAYWLVSTRAVGRGSDFVAGFVAGMLVALRPPFVVLLPFVALHRRAQLPGAAAGFLACMVLPLLMNSHVWMYYASAMQTNSDYYRHTSLPPRPPQAFPEMIEGASTAILEKMTGYYPYVDVTVYALARRSGWGILPDLPFILVFGGLFLGWLFWKRRADVESLLPGMAAWLFLSDLIMPTTRWGYYDVNILNVVLAGIIVAKKLPWVVLPALIATLVMCSFYVVANLPVCLLYVSEALFVLCAILCVFWSRTSEPETRAT